MTGCTGVLKKILNKFQLSNIGQKCINNSKNILKIEKFVIKLETDPNIKEEGVKIHMDIFSVQSLKFITCIDGYSKFLVIQQIKDKINLKDKVLEILQGFPKKENNN